MKTNKAKATMKRFRLDKPVKFDIWYTQERMDSLSRDLEDLNGQLFGTRQQLIDQLTDIQRMVV